MARYRLSAIGAAAVFELAALTAVLAPLWSSAAAPGQGPGGREATATVPAPTARDLAIRGNAAIARGDYAAAQESFEGVVACGGGEYRPRALAGLAALRRLEDRPWLGVPLLREADACFDGWDMSNGLVLWSRRTVLAESARTYVALGVPDVAYDYLPELRACSQAPCDWFNATVLTLDVLSAQHDWVRARERAVAALADVRIDDPSVWAVQRAARAAIRFRLAIADRNLAATDAALRAAAVALLELSDSGLPELLQQRAIATAADCRLEAGDLADATAAHERVELPAELGSKYAAEVLAQRARIAMARGASGADLSELHDRLAAGVEDWLAEWRSMPVRPGGVGTLHFATHRAAIATLLELDRYVLGGGAEDDERAVAAVFDHLEAALASGTLARGLGVGVTLADEQALAPADGGLLMFLSGIGSGSLLLVERDHVSHHVVRLDHGHEAAARALREAVDKPPPADARSAKGLAIVERLADRVAAGLLPDAVRRRLAGWRTIVLVGPELDRRDLQALHTGDGWLALGHALVHASSVSVLRGLRDRAARRPTPPGARLDVAVVGDPLLDPAAAKRWFVEPLAMTAAQRASLTAGLSPSQWHAWWGTAATAGALALPAVRSARALCVFTHGVQDYARERSAGLLLADGNGARALFADAIERLQVPAVVLLGVCGAAAGPVRMGDDGANHLGGAFLSAGADSVLLASGDLSVGATRDLLGHTLAEWQRGANLAEALRRARVRIAAEPARAHPYFFAGLRLVGLDSRHD
ncbi:MAG: CHAT domain-containing protein [Planctomycetes bacterium]|nr:CHAT domain-containing protein [Planctomycetota bacterium]